MSEPLKLTKGSVHYRPKATRAREQCGNCVMFEPGTNANNGTCSLVDGEILPANVCDRWEPAR